MKSLKYVSLILFVLAMWAFAFIYPKLSFADDWFCKQAASERIGNIINACGIGYGVNEAEARADAFLAAMDEFNKVCSASVDCYKHGNLAVAKRTECSQKNGKFQCYRMVEFTIKIQNKKDKPESKKKTMEAQNQIIYPFGKPGLVCAIGGWANLIAPALVLMPYEIIAGNNWNPTEEECNCGEHPLRKGCREWRDKQEICREYSSFPGCSYDRAAWAKFAKHWDLN